MHAKLHAAIVAFIALMLLTIVVVFRSAEMLRELRPHDWRFPLYVLASAQWPLQTEHGWLMPRYFMLGLTSGLLLLAWFVWRNHAWPRPVTIALGALSLAAVWFAYRGMMITEHSGYLQRATWVPTYRAYALVATGISVCAMSAATWAWYQAQPPTKRLGQTLGTSMSMLLVGGAAGLLIRMLIEQGWHTPLTGPREARLDHEAIVQLLVLLIAWLALTGIGLTVVLAVGARRARRAANATAHVPPTPTPPAAA